MSYSQARNQDFAKGGGLGSKNASYKRRVKQTSATQEYRTRGVGVKSPSLGDFCDF